MDGTENTVFFKPGVAGFRQEDDPEFRVGNVLQGSGGLSDASRGDALYIQSAAALRKNEGGICQEGQYKFVGAAGRHQGGGSALQGACLDRKSVV